MTNSIGQLATSLCAALAVTALIANPALAQDKKAAGEGTLKEIAQNDKVRVAEVTYQPGQGSPSQKRPMRVAHALTDGTIERIYADGTKEVTQWKAGDTRIISEPRAYAIKNIGKDTIRILVIFVK